MWPQMMIEPDRRHGLTVIPGGLEQSIKINRVDVPLAVLLGDSNGHSLPKLFHPDYLSTRTPEEHERLRLQGVDVLHLKLELTHSFTTSFGTIKDKDIILVVLKTAGGIEGIGECSVNPNPDYNEESAETVLTVLDKHLIPIIGELMGVSSIEDLTRSYENIKGNFAAKTGIEAAYWDLLSKTENTALHKYWGGRQVHVQTGVSIGGKTTEEVLHRVDKAVERGFSRVKLKIWPGFDTRVVEEVRSRYSDLPLQVDANSAYTLEDIDVFKELDHYGLILIEQPFSQYDLLDHARLQTQIETPVCLDESLKTVAIVRQAMELWAHIGKLDKLIINIKPPRMGGYWEAVKTADLCEAAGVRAWCGGMLDTSWTKRMNVQLSSHPAFVLPGDHAQQEPYYREDIADAPIQGRHGIISLPRLSQRYEDLDWSAIRKNTVSSKSYRFS